MNKKFVNVMLLLAVTGTGCCTFTSCKDNDDDMRVEWSQSDVDLQKKLDQVTAELEALKQASQACRTECQNQIADLLQKLGLKADKSEVERITNELTAKIDTKVTADDVRRIFGEEYFQKLGNYTKEDIENLITNVTYLTTTVNNLTTQYNDLTTIVNGIKENTYTKEEVNTLIDTKCAELKGQLDELKQSFEYYKSVVTTQLENLESSIEGNKNEIAALKNRVAELETAVNDLNALKSRVDTIETNLNATQEAVIQVFYQVLDNMDRLDVLEALVGDCENLQSLADEIRALKSNYTSLEDKLNSVNTDLQQKYEELGLKDAALAQDIENLAARVSANESEIAALKTQVNKLLGLEDRLNSLITSVLVQGTFNPLFGTFSLPIGVQSNMLVNYYGLSEKQTYNFPSVQNIATYDNQLQITEGERRMLEASGYNQLAIENGAVLIKNEDGNLGKVFVTINPNNVNFEGQDLKLVNSLDEESAVELRNLRPSKELLTFGYSKAGGSNNGFYEADATLPANMEAITSTAIHINDNLKSSMKTILSDRRNNLRTNLTGLMKAVYDQFNGLLPAYAMKAGWTVDGQDYAVYSNYNIATATFKPLSFGFCYGKGFDEVLPTIDPLREALLSIDPSQFNFDFSGINVNINGGSATLDIHFDDIAIDRTSLNLEMTVTGDVYDSEGNIIGTTTLTGQVDPDDLNSFLDKIESAFNDKISGWNDMIQDAYRNSINSVMANVNAEVQNVLTQMEGQINGKIEDMITEIQDEVNGKIGAYVSKFNGFINDYNILAGKVNSILANPNAYLQPTMLYKGTNGAHYLSGNVNKPSKFRKAGGNGIMLYATTYTAEIIAPAYKKFVACTNVIDATGKTAQANGGELLDELKSINKTNFFAEVRPGDQRRFALSTANLKVGHTYEILYTAVDYVGVTSTKRFYFTVVE